MGCGSRGVTVREPADCGCIRIGDTGDDLSHPGVRGPCSGDRTGVPRRRRDHSNTVAATGFADRFAGHGQRSDRAATHRRRAASASSIVDGRRHRELRSAGGGGCGSCRALAASCIVDRAADGVDPTQGRRPKNSGRRPLLRRTVPASAPLGKWPLAAADGVGPGAVNRAPSGGSTARCPDVFRCEISVGSSAGNPRSDETTRLSQRGPRSGLRLEVADAISARERPGVRHGGSAMHIPDDRQRGRADIGAGPGLVGVRGFRCRELIGDVGRRSLGRFDASPGCRIPPAATNRPRRRRACRTRHGCPNTVLILFEGGQLGAGRHVAGARSRR